MKKRWMVVIGCVLLVALAVVLADPIGMTVTKRHSPFATAGGLRGDLALAVEYCRPNMKGREIFGGLVPYGEVWRTGANEATLFRTNKRIDFGGEIVEAGTYSLFTIPGEEEWTFVLNRVVEQWGAYDYDATQDVVRVKAKSAKREGALEQLTISFEEGDASVHMVLAWEKTSVTLSIREASDDALVEVDDRGE